VGFDLAPAQLPRQEAYPMSLRMVDAWPPAL
jgi:hypothetical protein